MEDATNPTKPYVMMTQAEHDRIFIERVKPWRDMALAMGLDIQLFDARIAIKKLATDSFLSEARDYYKYNNNLTKER